jgi:SET domain-containing protein
MLVSSYVSPKALKGQPSAIDRRGVIAQEPIARHEIVAIKGGHIVDSATLESLPAPTRGSDVQIADDFFVAARTAEEYEPVMVFLNHSCEPNVGLAGNIVFIAMRDIDAGEELTTDYALFDDYDGQMECRCGTALCRKTIDGRDWQRPELQRRYGNYFSWYLLNKINPMPDPVQS